MAWYEIVGATALWFLGLFLKGKYFDCKKNMYHNESWKNKKK